MTRTVSPSPEQLGGLVQELRELRDLIIDGDFYNDYDGSVARIATFDKAADALESAQSEIVRLTTALENVRTVVARGTRGPGLSGAPSDFEFIIEMIDAARKETSHDYGKR